MPQYIPVDYDPYDPTQTAQRLRTQGYNVAPNGLVYQGNPQADLEAAKNTMYGMTGIPDLQAAWAAYRRGETLPAIGQGLWGAANLATLAAPAAKALQPGLRALPTMLEDISGAQSVKNALGRVVPLDNPLLGTQKGVSNTLMAPQEKLAAKLDQIDALQQPLPMESGNFFRRKVEEAIVKKYGLAPLIAGGALTLTDNPAGAQHLVPVDHNPFIEPPPAQGGAVVPIAQPVAPQQLPFPFPVAPPPVYGDYIEPPPKF